MKIYGTRCANTHKGFKIRIKEPFATNNLKIQQKLHDDSVGWDDEAFRWHSVSTDFAFIYGFNGSSHSTKRSIIGTNEEDLFNALDLPEIVLEERDNPLFVYADETIDFTKGFKIKMVNLFLQRCIEEALFERDIGYSGSLRYERYDHLIYGISSIPLTDGYDEVKCHKQLALQGVNSEEEFDKIDLPEVYLIQNEHDRTRYFSYWQPDDYGRHYINELHDKVIRVEETTGVVLTRLKELERALIEVEVVGSYKSIAKNMLLDYNQMIQITKLMQSMLRQLRDNQERLL